MRFTRLGAAAVGLSAFALFAAASTGNNLLYLVFAATAASLALSLAAGWWNLRGLSARLELPDQVFRGSAFSARLAIDNPRPFTARLVRAAGPLGAAAPGDVPPGGSAKVELRLNLPSRGLNRLEGLFLESLYPFGFFVSRRRLPPFEALALPPASPFRPHGALEADPRAPAASGASARRNSAGEGDFFGPRPYAPEDDSRLIHWKLTAKTGRPVVGEFASAPEGRALVRLDGLDEPAIERTAAACRWHVDSGAETGLVGPGLEVPPARGLGQLDKLLRALALAGEGARARPAPGAPKPRDEGAVDTPALRRLTFLGGALVYVSLFLVEDLDPSRLLLLAPLLPLGWRLHERGGPFPPPALWNVASTALLAFLLLVDWKVSGVAVANLHLLGYLLINRLLNPWTRGELRQAFLILYLAFFLVSGLTISPWYFPLFVGWVAFSGAWLMLQSGAEPSRAGSWGAALLRLLAGGAALGTLLFVAIPRVEGLRRFNPFVASGMDKLQVQSQAVVGFTENVSLGYFGTLRRSSARVMRLRPAAPVEGTPPPVYVRGAAFDRFDGRAWGRATLGFRLKSGKRSDPSGQAWVRPQGALLTFPTPPAPGASYWIELYPMQVSIVFTVGAPRTIDGLDMPVSFDHTDTLRASSPINSAVRYRVDAGAPGRGPAEAAVNLRERALREALRTPPDPSGRVAALAARWTRGLRKPEERIDAVVGRLTREYGYSAHSEKRSTLEDFLFDARAGNCEYFASAAAVLLRHAGVPTRLVTGFRASDWNEWNRFYDVRQGNAHAWTEAWIEGRGWIVVDATPAESGFSAAADALSRRLSRWADALQTRWYRSVIGYDQSTQRNTLLRLSFGRVFGRVQDALETGLKRVLPPLIALGLLLWLLRSARVWLRGGDEYESAERLLARKGLPRRPWQTAREFADEVRARRPELAALSELVEQHYSRRYAGSAPDARSRRRARELLAELKAKL